MSVTEKKNARAAFLNKAYVVAVVGLLCGVYASGAYAYMSVDETNGPFAEYGCMVLGWIMRFIIPCGGLAIAAVMAGFMWGGQLPEMLQKFVYSIIAVVAAIFGVSVIQLIANKAGFSFLCN